MDCRFTIDYKTLGLEMGSYKNKNLSLLDLTKMYYKNTSQLSNNKIYSSEEIQESTAKILHKINTQTVRESINENEDLVGASDYITKQEEGFIALGWNSDRLSPEYIEDKRIFNYIKKNIDESIKINKNLKPHKDLPKYLSQFGEDVNIEKVNFLLHDIIDEIESEQKTKGLRYAIRNILNLYIKENLSSNSDTVLKAALREVENNSDILAGDKEAWAKKLVTICDSVYNNLTAKGTIISDVLIASDKDAKAQIKGSIDVIAVDEAGNSHIYSIKISTKPYQEWDSAKKVTTDWQLVLYRQLLGQHVNISDTELNIIPITIGKPSSTGTYSQNSLQFGGVVSRSAEASRVQNEGHFTDFARKLIPTKIIPTYNEERVNEVNSDLNTIFGTSYEIKTASKTFDADVIIDRQKKKKRSSEPFTYNNRFSDISIAKGIISEMSEDVFRAKLGIVLEREKKDRNFNLTSLRSALIKTIDSPEEGASIKMYGSPERDEYVNNILKNYTTGQYRVVSDSIESSALGLIVLQNKKSGDIVLLTINAANQKAQSASGLSHLEMEYVKAFVYLNKFKPELRNANIQKIIAMNIEALQEDHVNMQRGYEIYRTKMREHGLVDNLNKNDFISVDKEAGIAVDEMLKTVPEESADAKTLKYILGGYDNVSLKMVELADLKDIQRRFLEQYPRLKKRTLVADFAFNDKIEYIYGLLQAAIVMKSGELPHADFVGFRNFGLNFPDMKSLFTIFSKDNQANYSKEEKKISGILAGLRMSTPDKINSKDLLSINRIIQTANQNVAHAMYEQSSIIHGHTTNYYKAANFTKTNQNIIGNDRKYFENFFAKDGKEISKELKTKNPYLVDVKNALTPSERIYLKNILFEMQKHLLDLSRNEADKIDITSIESIKKTDSSGKLLEAIESGDYFQIPLIRNSLISRNNTMFKGGISEFFRKGTGLAKEKLHEYFDPRELTEEERAYADDAQLGIYEMYDLYSRHTPGFKSETITEKGGIEYAELNLDTIAHRVAFSKLRKKELDHKLPVIHAYVWWMKLHAGKQNKDISAELKYVSDQLSLAAYDKPIIEKELEDVVSAANAVKKITTFGMLAFRPVLMVKELSIGMFKGLAVASTQIYGEDQFNTGDLRKALVKLATIDKTFSTEFNLIQGLNNYYRFANLDINTYSGSLQTNRTGLFRGLGHWMYACNTIPDYYNRMAIFLAKAIHDGSYEAHSMDENGLLHYDPTKDMRFKHYFTNRDRYVDSKGRYIPAPSDKKYNRQRNEYVWLINQLNQERGVDVAELGEKDLIRQAYSEKQRASLKSFTDTAYGYYDKDSQAQLHNLAFGMIFLQYLQYWPGKINQWFGRSISAEDSPQGRLTQKTEKIGDKKVKVWREPVYGDSNDPDLITYFKETHEDTGDPWVEWEGTPQEGLYYALVGTCREVAKGNWKEAKDNKLRISRAKYALADTALMMLLFSLFSVILKALIEQEGTKSLSGNVLQFSEAVTRRVVTESNVYQNTFGAVNTEPAFMSYGTKIAGDAWDVLTGDKSAGKLLSNVKMFEMIDFE